MPKLRSDRPRGAMPGAVYLSAADLAARYSVDSASIWRWSARGILPQPVKLSDGVTRWIAAEIEARDASLAAARSSAA